MEGRDGYSQGTLPCKTPTCSELFLWARSDCAHVSSSLTMHHPSYWTICLRIGCVNVGRLLSPVACALSSLLFPCPCSADLALRRPAVPLVCASLCLLVCAVPGEPVEHSFVCLSDVGYAACVFITVMLPWFTLPLTNLWLLFSLFLFFC